MATEVSVRDRRALPALAVYLVAVTVVAGLGGLASGLGLGEDGWYAAADRPFFTPPNGVFGPVWTVLYIAMALAGWLLWRRRPAHPKQGTRALRLWWLQLVLNLLWSPVFFAAQLLWGGLAVIVALDLVLVLLIRVSWTVSRPAALLLAPYLAWVLFATALNAGFAILN